MNFVISGKTETPFLNRIGIYQDGTTPMYRDVDGKLWAMSGHSHMGHIGMFCGTSLEDMEERYPISTNFCVGHAEYAFAGIRYPRGYRRPAVYGRSVFISAPAHTVSSASSTMRPVGTGREPATIPLAIAPNPPLIPISATLV